MNALELTRGDTNKINLAVRRPRIDPATGRQVKDVAGLPIFDPVNLTGATLALTAITKAGVPEIALDSGTGGIVPVIPFSDGLAVATVPPAMTANMKTPLYMDFDVQLLEADNTKTTIAKGQMVVTGDVTAG